MVLWSTSGTSLDVPRQPSESFSESVSPRLQVKQPSAPPALDQAFLPVLPETPRARRKGTPLLPR